MRSNDRKKRLKELYIEDLGQVTGGLPPFATTLALGEEGPIYTSFAIGEETPVTTLALGEEGPIYTTLALGEETDDDV